MTNNNNPSPTEQTGVSREYFEKLVSSLPEEDRKVIGTFDKEFKNDTIEPVKTATDQEKINAYDQLEVKNLPQDWKAQLLRLKSLEEKLATLTEIEENLKGWTDTFTEKQPLEVQEQITNLEESKKITEETLNAKIQELATKLTKSNQESQEKITNLEQKNQALETELNDWKQICEGKELQEVKEEWDFLKQRPDASISTAEFYQDYAKRPTLTKFAELEEKIEKAERKLEKKAEQLKTLEQAIDRFLASERTRRYVLMSSVSSPEQAQQEIKKLLTKTEQDWIDYLQNGEENYRLEFSLKNEARKQKANEILNWIAEAKQSQDYQILFEKWSNGKEYNSTYDFDGTLYLLSKYLEIK